MTSLAVFFFLTGKMIVSKSQKLGPEKHSKEPSILKLNYPASISPQL